jgi:hypothetical protein
MAKPLTEAERRAASVICVTRGEWEALEAQLAAARGIARRLAGVVRGAWAELQITDPCEPLVAFDALHWPDP